ncbi:MAG: GNAT family N-acetyltransferase [Chloroflexales bacterium]
MTITFTSAATLSLEALADLFTRSFEGYFYPGTTTTEAMARRVRVESLDLCASPVILADGEPAGVALIGRRGDHAWCGGFGVVAAQRGHGLATALTVEMLSRARSTGAGRLTLEVLTRNERAVRICERAGIEITRRLLVMIWHPSDEDDNADPSPLVEVAPAELLNHFIGMHPAPAAWQRDLPALLVTSGLRGLAIPGDSGPAAYALVTGDTEGLRLADLGARNVTSAHALLRGLQAQTRSLVSINEPTESSLTVAFYRAGFIIVDKQHEMEITL